MSYLTRSAEMTATATVVPTLSLATLPSTKEPSMSAVVLNLDIPAATGEKLTRAQRANPGVPGYMYYDPERSADSLDQIRYVQRQRTREASAREARLQRMRDEERARTAAN